MSTQKIAFRADASSEVGTGHIMRCLALVQAAGDLGIKVFFITSRECPPQITERIEEESAEIIKLPVQSGSREDLRLTAETLTRLNYPWLIVDGYRFDARYQLGLKKAGIKHLFIDDYGHCSSYHAKFILNQNIYAKPEMYSTKDEGVKLLLGTKFALLRKEFRNYKVSVPKNHPDIARNILVTLGGSDPDNITAKVMDVFGPLAIRDFRIKLIVGGGNPRAEEIRRRASASAVEFEIINNARNMPELMNWADLAFSAAGSTCWELCFMRVPAVVVYIADNQKPIAEGLNSVSAAFSLGAGHNLNIKSAAKTIRELVNDSKTRAKISRNAGKLVDGRGCERVMERILS